MNPDLLPQLTDREFMALIAGAVAGIVVGVGGLILRALRLDKAHDKILRKLFPEEYL